MPVGKAALRGRVPEREILRFVVDEAVRLAESIVAVARPCVVLGRAHDPGPHGVKVSIPHHREDVPAVRVGLNQRRLHPLGDDLAAPARLPLVVPAREELVDDLPEATELLLPARGDHDDVRVRAHEAVRAEEDAVARGVLLEKRKEEALGGVVFEDAREIVAPPGAVVGGTEVDEKAARRAGHGRGESKPRAEEPSDLVLGSDARGEKWAVPRLHREDELSVTHFSRELSVTHFFGEKWAVPRLHREDELSVTHFSHFSPA